MGVVDGCAFLTLDLVKGCTLRALLRRYTDSSGDDHNLAFFLQLELNGLGRLGNDIEQTLERGIYGYRTDEDD